MSYDDLIAKTYPRIDNMPPEELDALGFGAIQLDFDGKILQYNAYESQLAKMSPDKVVGRNFFREVAPCTNVQEFYGQFKQGVQLKNLDVKFRYRFVFKNQPPRNVLISMRYSTSSSTTWIFVQPM